MVLCTPEVSSTLKETDDDVEFATDMEEPVCVGSEEHNHQQERHPHRITIVYLGFLRIVTLSSCGELLSYKSWKKMGLTNTILTTARLITRKSREERH